MQDPRPSYDGLSIRIERLYQRLLALDAAPALEAALSEVLRLLADVTDCEVALVDILGATSTPICVGHAHGDVPLEELHARVPPALVQRAFDEQRLIELAFIADPVRWRETTVALCTPIGGALPLGFLYVEGVGPFASVDRARVESVAQHLANVRALVLGGRNASLADRIRLLREQCVRDELARHGGNVSEAARQLGIGRGLLYRVLEREAGE